MTSIQVRVFVIGAAGVMSLYPRLDIVVKLK
jgi:hypothetical protein